MCTSNRSTPVQAEKHPDKYASGVYGEGRPIEQIAGSIEWTLPKTPL